MHAALLPDCTLLRRKSVPNPPQIQSQQAQPKPKKEEITLKTIYLKPNGTNMGYVTVPDCRMRLIPTPKAVSYAASATIGGRGSFHIPC